METNARSHFDCLIKLPFISPGFQRKSNSKLRHNKTGKENIIKIQVDIGKKKTAST
jgi:hypothetical protein